MKRLKTIVKKKEKERNRRKREEIKKGRGKREKGKAPSHSQETQMNLKIVSFLFLQGPNLFHCLFYPFCTIMNSETRLWVQCHRLSELETTVEMISNPLVLWIHKLRPKEGNDFNKASS